MCKNFTNIYKYKIQEINFNLVFAVIVLCLFSIQTYSQVVQLPKEEWEVLRSDERINYYTAYRNGRYPTIYKVIDEFRNKVTQIFLLTEPKDPYGIQLNLSKEFGKESLRTGFNLAFKDENSGKRITIYFWQFRENTAYINAKNDRLNLLNGGDDYRNHASTICNNEGIFSLTTDRLDYFNDESKTQVVLGLDNGQNENFMGMEAERSLLNDIAKKVCISFKELGIYNLTDFLFSLPYEGIQQGNSITSSKKIPEKREQSIPEPTKEIIDDPIVVTIELKDTDNQFTLADEAILNVVIKNQSDEKLENLEFEIEVVKDKVTLPEDYFRPSAKEKFKGILFWEPAISLKTENEDNAWMYKNLLMDNSSPPLIREFFNIKIRNTSGVKLYDKQTSILNNGEGAKLSYPNFVNPSTKIPDKDHLDYYLKGDEYLVLLTMSI